MLTILHIIFLSDWIGLWIWGMILDEKPDVEILGLKGKNCNWPFLLVIITTPIAIAPLA